ncbi:hypothetical protein [Thorsellia kenyensis]|uniref:Uncharacterized protein n=1 Tax=Thorsellia kenyensis TaxID=1549888 RepID=A0ABV6C7E6_9GAMM
MKKNKLFLIGQANCTLTLKAKVWLDLQKIEYDFFDRSKINLDNLVEQLPTPYSFEELAGHLVSALHKHSDAEKNIQQSIQTQESSGFVLPILLLNKPKSHIQENSVSFVQGFCANKYLKFVNEHF